MLLRGTFPGPLVAAGLLLASSAVAPAGEVLVLRVGTNAPDGSPWVEGTIASGRLAEKNSKGAVRFKVFPSGMLGDEQQLMASIAAGGIDGGALSAAATFDYLPELAALELPYTFPTGPVTDRALERVFPHLQKAARGHGYLMGVYTSIGFRHLGTPRPVSSVADLRALRVRSQPSTLHARMWTLLGVKDRPMALPHVAGALDRGEVNAFDAALVWMFGAGWHAFIKTLTLSSHIHQPGFVVLGPKAVLKVPVALRERLFEGAAQVGRDSVLRVREIEAQLLQQLPGMGVSVVPPTAALAEEMKQALGRMRPDWRATASPAGQTLLDAIEAQVARARKR